MENGICPWHVGVNLTSPTELNRSFHRVTSDGYIVPQNQSSGLRIAGFCAIGRTAIARIGRPCAVPTLSLRYRSSPKAPDREARAMFAIWWASSRYLRTWMFESFAILTICYDKLHELIESNFNWESDVSRGRSGEGK
jgi:hypothetical protein